MIKRDHPDFIRWMLNHVVPLLTRFGVLNLIVSSEAIEGFFNFFQDTRPGTSRNYVGLDGIIMHGKAATPKKELGVQQFKRDTEERRRNVTIEFHNIQLRILMGLRMVLSVGLNQGEVMPSQEKFNP